MFSLPDGRIAEEADIEMAGTERAAAKKPARSAGRPRGEPAKRAARPKPGAGVPSSAAAAAAPRSPAEHALRVLDFRPARSATPAATLLKRVRSGMAVGHAEALAGRIGVDPRRLYGIIGVSERTAARKKAESRPLDAEQSDVLARVARIVGLAEDVLESAEAAHRWLDKPNRVLGATPLSLLDTDIGTEQVEEVLMRIQYGVYS